MFIAEFILETSRLCGLARNILLSGLGLISRQGAKTRSFKFSIKKSPLTQTLLCAFAGKHSSPDSDLSPAKALNVKFSTKKSPLTKTPNFASLRPFDRAQDMLCGKIFFSGFGFVSCQGAKAQSY
jgi:hypothetical protein